MLLTDKIRRYLEEKKVINEGKNIHSSNKEIDLLNFDELQKELTYILYENKNVEKLDDRTVDLMSEYFSYGKGEQIGLDIAMQLARVFESEKVKQQIFQIYSKQKAFPTLEMLFLHNRGAHLPQNHKEPRKSASQPIADFAYHAARFHPTKYLTGGQRFGTGFFRFLLLLLF